MTTAIAQALSAALVHFMWQGLLVAFLLWVALFGLRKRSANSRYLASCLALAILALLPAITVCVLYMQPVVAHAVVQPAGTNPLFRVVERAGEISTASWWAGMQSWAVPAWSLGVLLFSLRLVWGCKQVSSMQRNGTPAERPVLEIIARLGARLDFTRQVRVLMTSAADGPSVVGWLRPVILLPSATLIGLTPEQLEAVLAHELGHIRRHDFAVNVLQILVETVLFYHPAVWWVSTRIRQERELCCDDLAVSSCGDAVCYARALTRLERLRIMGPVMDPGMAMASTGGPLLYRIERLIGAKTQEYGQSKLPGILALCLGLVCFAVNVHWARGQEQVQLEPGRYSFNMNTNQVRAEAGVSVDLGTAAILHRTSVDYPKSAIEKSVQGTVTVEATLDAAGGVSDVRVLSGPAELRRAALQSVFDWHFVPDSVGSTRQVSIAFDLAAARSQHADEQAPGSLVVFVNRSSGDTVELRTLRGSVGVASGREPTESGTAGQLRAVEPDLSQAGPEREKLREEMLQLGKEIEVLRSDESRTDLTLNRAELNEAQTRMRTLEDRLESSERQANPETTLAGRTVVDIDVLGFSDQARQALGSRLPVHLGDTLSTDSMDRIRDAVRNFDVHVETDVRVMENGQIALRFVAPKTGRRTKIQQEQ